jgi:hypothetical protein
MAEIESWDLANAVTSLAIIFAGLLTLAFTALMGRQPRRWVFAYACVLITGAPTLWYHGWGEVFPARVADIGTNLLLSWALQVGALGDYYAPRTQRIVAGASGLVNLAYIVWMILAGPLRPRVLAIPLGSFGGFTLGEVLLISNSLLAVGLLYARHAAIPGRARPLLYLLTGIFLAGALLATASNQQVDFRVLAYHATWHIVSAFGFVALWAFNHARFVMRG